MKLGKVAARTRSGIPIYEHMLKTKQEVIDWCNKWRIEAQVDVDLQVHCTRNVDIDKSAMLVSGMLPVNFHLCAKDFRIENADIVSLNGSPRMVGGTFTISNCPQLKTTRGGPGVVGERIHIYDVPKLRDYSDFPEVNDLRLSVAGFSEHNFAQLAGKKYSEIQLDKCQLTSLEGIAHLRGLKFLAIHANPLRTFTGLKGLTLQRLIVSIEQPLVDLLRNRPKIQTIHIDGIIDAKVRAEITTKLTDLLTGSCDKRDILLFQQLLITHGFDKAAEA